nr:hypothetical protein [Tanacetum cinerariifolium]
MSFFVDKEFAALAKLLKDNNAMKGSKIIKIRESCQHTLYTSFNAMPHQNDLSPKSISKTHQQNPTPFTLAIQTEWKSQMLCFGHRNLIAVDSTFGIKRLRLFMNYLEEQTDGEAMINLIKNGLSNDIYSLIDSNKTAKDLWDALARHMLGSEYGEQDRKVAVLVEQYVTMMRQNKNLMDINIDAFYNILKQNQGDVNDAMGLKKKTVVVTSDPLALIAEKTKKITALLAKAFNRRKFYSKPTNNNLRTSSTSQSANKKQEFVKTDDKKVETKDDEKNQDMSKVKCYNCKKEGHFVKDCKKVKVKDYEYYKIKMLLAKKDKDEQVLLAEDQAWMESSSDSDQEINANMVFMAYIEKVLSDSETSSTSADDKISEVSYYLSESESEYEYETSEYYDNTTTYGLFVNDNDDPEIFHDCENFPENLIESQIDHNE